MPLDAEAEELLEIPVFLRRTQDEREPPMGRKKQAPKVDEAAVIEAAVAGETGAIERADTNSPVTDLQLAERVIVVEAGHHSPIGASGMSRWKVCAGSVDFDPPAGPSAPSSEFALEGTAAHEIAARCLKEGKDAWEYSGWTVIVEGKKFEVVQEMVEGVQVFLDYVRGWEQKLAAENPTVLIEHGLSLAKIDKAAGGTADAAIVGATVIVAPDFKYGQGLEVEVKWNDQLLYYLAGIWLEMVDYQKAGVQKLVVAIVQPRAPSGEPIHEWELTPNELVEWIESTLKPAVARTRAKGRALVTGEHCRFCPKRLNCPALKGLVEDIELAVPNKDIVPSMTPEELAEWKRRVAAVRFLEKAIDDEILGRMLRGEAVPGWKTVQRKSDRVWKEGAEPVLVSALGVENIYETKLLSPARIEKLPGAKKLVTEHAYKPDAGLTLAPESDRRESVRRTADEVFAGVQ